MRTHHYLLFALLFLCCFIVLCGINLGVLEDNLLFMCGIVTDSSGSPNSNTLGQNKPRKTVRLYERIKPTIDSPSPFDCQFSAGMFDGDGTFQGSSKSSQPSVVFTTCLSDLGSFLWLQQRWGGYIYQVVGKQTICLSLNHAETSRFLLYSGPYLMNTSRIQLGLQYNLKLENLSSSVPTLSSGWLLGIIHSDGSFGFDPSSMKATVTFHFKDDVLYDVLSNCFGVGSFTKKTPTS